MSTEAATMSPRLKRIELRLEGERDVSATDEKHFFETHLVKLASLAAEEPPQATWISSVQLASSMSCLQTLFERRKTSSSSSSPPGTCDRDILMPTVVKLIRSRSKFVSTAAVSLFVAATSSSTARQLLQILSNIPINSAHDHMRLMQTIVALMNHHCDAVDDGSSSSSTTLATEVLSFSESLLSTTSTYFTTESTASLTHTQLEFFKWILRQRRALNRLPPLEEDDYLCNVLLRSFTGALRQPATRQQYLETLKSALHSPAEAPRNLEKISSGFLRALTTEAEFFAEHACVSHPRAGYTCRSFAAAAAAATDGGELSGGGVDPLEMNK